MKTDTRYTVTREFTGKPRKQYVARFCGDWIGSADSRNAARVIATNHRFDTCAESGSDLDAHPAADYRLAGAESVRVSTRRTYKAKLARCIPDWREKRLVFLNGILCQSGEYFVCR